MQVTITLVTAVVVVLASAGAGAQPRVLSPFGATTGPEGHQRQEGARQGVDLAAAVGTSVIVPAEGVVKRKRHRPEPRHARDCLLSSLGDQRADWPVSAARRRAGSHRCHRPRPRSWFRAPPFRGARRSRARCDAARSDAIYRRLFRQIEALPYRPTRADLPAAMFSKTLTAQCSTASGPFCFVRASR